MSVLDESLGPRWEFQKPWPRTPPARTPSPKYRYLNYPNIPGEDSLENDLVTAQRFTVDPGQWEGYGQQGSPLLPETVWSSGDDSAGECERASEPNIAQVLHLLNSELIDGKIRHENGTVAKLLRKFDDNGRLVDELFLMFYSRLPTDHEKLIVSEHFRILE